MRGITSQWQKFIRSILEILAAMKRVEQGNNTGAGGVQIGHQEGTVNITNHTFHITPHATPLEPAVTDEHKQLLRLMDGLNKVQRVQVLDFMHTNFQTRMVKELPQFEVFRTTRYVESVLGMPKVPGKVFKRK